MTQASDGTGNAVADLKAGYGAAAEEYASGRMEQAVERGRQIAAATGEGYVAPGAGTAVPEEVFSNWEDEAAYWKERCLRAEGAVPPLVSEGEAVVEQGDGFYWMRRARRAEGALRQVSHLIVAVGRRVRKAEDILRGWRERTDGQ